MTPLISRKLLIQDLNDLKYQQDEARSGTLAKQSEDNHGAEDVTMLKLALRYVFCLYFQVLGDWLSGYTSACNFLFLTL